MCETNLNLPWNEKLQHLRSEKGWSQYEAADRCGTNQKNYWNWEKGRSYPLKVFRKSIANAFDVKVKDIFELEEDPEEISEKKMKVG